MMHYGVKIDEKSGKIIDGYLTFESGLKVFLSSSECKEVEDRLRQAKAEGKDGTVKFAPQVEQIEFTVRSYYKHCNTEWDTDWNCACDDECPICRKAISPYRHEDI